MPAIAFPDALPQTITKGQSARSYEVLGPILDHLEKTDVDSPAGMHAFLDECNEVFAWFGEEFSKTYLATSLDTTDSAEQEAWRILNTETLPKASPHFDRLNRKLLASPSLHELEGTDYWHYVLQAQREIELYREANIPLEAACSQLTTEYQQITGQWSAEFRGAVYPLTEMGQFHEDADREVRRQAFLACAETRRKDSARIDEIFGELLALRKEIANNAGFDNYRDYVFRERGRDYTPALCAELVDAVRREIVPLQSAFAARTRANLSLDRTRPWDGRADPDGLPPLRPYADSEALVSLTAEVLRRVSPDLGQAFGRLQAHMDLGARAKKAPGGFMLQFDLERRPFIFANASGLHSDVVTLLHETGHALHHLLGAEKTPVAGLRPPIEFAEVASMTLELLPVPHFDVYYPDTAAADRARRASWTRALRVLVGAARGEEFQRRVYTEDEGKSPSTIWSEVCRGFDPDTDWEGHTDTMDTVWHQVTHFFSVPFYYVEYGFAQLAALRLAKSAEEDMEGTLANYRSALKRGPCGTATTLYRAAGLPLLANASDLSELIAWVRGKALPVEK